jgi:hypothetical protein
MKKYIALLTLSLAVTAQADQFETAHIDRSITNYEFKIDLPQFNAHSVPGYSKINATLVSTIESYACDPSQDSVIPSGYYYDSTSHVVALNNKYVAVETSGDDYCGGAHPNTFDNFMTFDAQTGEVLDIAKEFGFVDYQDLTYNQAQQDALSNKVAKILLAHLPADNDCFKNLSSEEKLQELQTMYPHVAGLAKEGTVVLSVDPAHVVAACGFSVRVHKNEVAKLLKRGSYLENWLK